MLRNERLVGLILENLEDLITVLDLQGRHLYNSPSCRGVLGETYPTPGADFFREIHPDDRERIRRFFRDTVRTGVGWRAEYRVLAGDGRMYHMESQANAIRDADGRPEQVMVISRDVTDRTQAVKKLSLIAHALTCTRDSFCLTDLNNTILFTNPAFCEMYGYSEEELLGKNIEIVRPPRNSVRLTREILSATMAGSWNGELLNCRKNGSEFPVELWTSVVRDDTGEPVGLVGIARDISERKRGERLHAAVYRIAQAADLAPTLDELFRAVHGIIHEVMSANNFYIALYDERADLISFPYFVDEIDSPSPPRKLEKGLTEYVLRTGKPLLCTNTIHEELKRRGEAELIGAPSPIWLGVPLVVERKTIGVMVVQHYANPDAYGEQEQSILEFVSSQVARAIERKAAEEALRVSEERYRRFVAQSSEGIWRFEIGKPIPASLPPGDQIGLLYSGAYLAECNDAMAHIYGFSKAKEIIGSGMEELLPADQDGNRELLAAFIQSGYRLTDAESRWTDGNGNVIYFLNNLVGMVDAGSLKSVWGTQRDVTEHRRAEELLRVSEEKYRTLFEESKDGIFLSTPDGQLVDVNASGIELFGYESKEELLRIDIARDLYVNARDREFFKTRLSRHGFVLDFEFEIKRKNGERRIVLESASAVRDDEGNIVAYRGFLRDITGRKKLEEQLRQAQKMEGIGTLAGGIAHDFNNILGIIIGYTTMMQRNVGDADQLRQGLETIELAVERGAALVRQLLTFARKTDPLFQSIDVNETVRELSKMLTETFPKMITISVRLEEGVPSIVADASQLHQALLNLSLNARDAMLDWSGGTGGGTLTLRTSVCPAGALRAKFSGAVADDYVRITVEDNGKGMDEEIKNRIFEPFFTTKELGKGSGLGLAVVYGVVNSHHGFIDIETGSGAGTKFSIYLPAESRTIVSHSAEHRDRIEPCGGHETILVVEDEEMLCELLKGLLEQQGYRVLTANDGRTGVEIYRNHMDEIALILSDMGLPKLGGWEMFQEMKAINPHVKAILASGYFDPRLKSDMVKAGAKDFIQKPYMLDVVMQRVRDIIDGTTA